MRYFIIAAVVPIIGIVVISIAKLNGAEIVAYKALDWLSILGFVLTYLGFLFSLFAAVKVRELSELYFSRLMLPSITNQINEIVAYMSASASAPINQIDIDRKLHKIPAVLTSIEGTKGHNAGAAITEVREKYNDLRRWMDRNRTFGRPVSDSQEYWALLSKLSEVGEFILASMEQQKAR